MLLVLSIRAKVPAFGHILRGIEIIVGREGWPVLMCYHKFLVKIVETTVGSSERIDGVI